MPPALKKLSRGEMWLGRGLFRELGWEDSLEIHLRLCAEAQMDFVFLPIATALPHDHFLDYRYFSPDSISELRKDTRQLNTGAVINGPFQMLTQKLGLERLLGEWYRPDTANFFKREALNSGILLAACIGHKPDIIVIADDIAYSHATYVNPSDLEPTLFTFYREWIKQAHKEHIQILFHSDGQISAVLPALLDCGFDGLAACQYELLDLNSISTRSLTLLGGIPTEMIESSNLGDSDKEQFQEQLSKLASAGKVILCSSRGLSTAGHLLNLKKLYNWSDDLSIET